MKPQDSQKEHRHFPKSVWKALYAMLLGDGEVTCGYCKRTIYPNSKILRKAFMGIFLLLQFLVAGMLIYFVDTSWLAEGMVDYFKWEQENPFLAYIATFIVSALITSMLLIPFVYCVKWVDKEEKEKAEEEERKEMEKYGAKLRWPTDPHEETGEEKTKKKTS